MFVETFNIMTQQRIALGRKLKNYRIREGISVYEIVKNCDITQPTVVIIESGLKGYNIDKLLTYCKYINYNPFK